MDALALTGLPRELSQPRRVAGADLLAQGWADLDIVLRLGVIGRRRSDDLGSHLRRSFLGALGPAASPAARAGQPCIWDPPCALDVFCREQLRHAGDGLPKPFVLALHPEGEDMLVTLRVFGMAIDWAMAAAEGLAAGIAGILPWARVMPGLSGPPPILDRTVVPSSLPTPQTGPTRLTFLSPVDMKGANPSGPGDLAARLASRMLRRVDAMARWNGLALSDEALRALTTMAHGLQTRATSSVLAQKDSPNRKGQARLNSVMTGWIEIDEIPSQLWPIFALAMRCHVGRHATEGLGAFHIGPAVP